MSSRGRQRKHDAPRSCAVCGCTDITPCACEDGANCHWCEPDLCSACVAGGHPLADELAQGGFSELAFRVRSAYEKYVNVPMVELATEGELNAMLRARKAGA
jgi:hypothetical protein